MKGKVRVLDRKAKIVDRTVQIVDRASKIVDRTVIPVDRTSKSTDRTVKVPPDTTAKKEILILDRAKFSITLYEECLNL